MPTPRTTPKGQTLADKIENIRNEFFERDSDRDKSIQEMRANISDNTDAIKSMAESVKSVEANINGFSMESFSDTLDKLVLLIDGDDSRDVTGLRKRMRDVETVQAEQNKSLARIEKKLTNLGIMIIVITVAIEGMGGEGFAGILAVLAKLFGIGP